MFTPLVAASLPEIAALITAVGGIIIGVLAALRTQRQDKASSEVSEQQTLLEGYAQIVKDLREEITRIRKQYTEDLLTWKTEKELLLSQQDSLREELAKAKQTARRRRAAREVRNQDE